IVSPLPPGKPNFKSFPKRLTASCWCAIGYESAWENSRTAVSENNNRCSLWRNRKTRDVRLNYPIAWVRKVNSLAERMHRQ
ncbi:MAG: hypothetical protein ABR991_04010, partial [Terracidiphilus sp.]